MNGIKVSLEAFFETGTEGVCWILHDLRKVKTKRTLFPVGGWIDVYTDDTGYTSMIQLKDGDRLKVFMDKDCREVLWEGEVKKDYKTNRCLYKWVDDLVKARNYNELRNKLDQHDLSNDGLLEHAHEHLSQQVANGMWCHWLQENVDPDFWGDMFKRELVAEYMPG